MVERLITSLRGACTASNEAIQSKTVNLLDCFVLITFVLAMTKQCKMNTATLSGWGMQCRKSTGFQSLIPRVYR
ncbi:MAG: hypothetical protein LBK53_08195 [Heliobacteriaceae bacterium]|nr:hypothetical protein [Heliobacteriaceae bacterium]